MTTTNDFPFDAELSRTVSVPSNHPENDSVNHDAADGANWESAWIDLGGEG